MLQTNAEVLDALGGDDVARALTGTGYKTVNGWRNGDRFGARYFLVMMDGLHRKGFSANPELWGQVTPQSRKAAIGAIVSALRPKAA